MSMQLSKRGMAFITEREGLRLKAYKDGGGVWTIGYGHTGPEVVEGLVISIAKAEALFLQDTQKFVDDVNKALGDTPVTQGQFDALVSFTYNVGKANLGRSSVLKLTKAGKRAEAADAFRAWNKVRNATTKLLEVDKGIVKRREAERSLYLN
jgi:lysozyme